MYGTHAESWVLIRVKTGGFWVLAWILCHIQICAQVGKCDSRIVNEYRHDESIFTQGLYWEPGRILESSGGYGQSRLVENQWPSGILIRKHILEDHQFAEGITVKGGRVYQLTWKAGALRV